MKIMIICLGLLITWQAQAISRVGKSSVGDSDEGFTAPISRSFVISRSLGEGALRVNSPFSDANSFGGHRPSELRFYRFRHQFPSMMGFNRQELEAHMVKSYPLWHKFEPLVTCIAVYVVRGEEGSAGLATWGQGFGVTIATGPSEFEWQSMLSTLHQLELTDGDCKWP